MPAKRLTADCIWNSFRSSGKCHIIITGKRGSGKTTLLSKLFPEVLPGLTSYAEPGKAVYLKDNLTAAQVRIGEFDPSLPGDENKMTLQKDGLLSLGVTSLKKSAEGEGEWITVDEIGYLEAECEQYREALLYAFAKKHVAAVVRKQDIALLNELCGRDDAFVVDLDKPFGNIACVIMASGVGKRFGTNKLMADFCGRPMIECILDATENVFSHRVAVTVHKDVAGLCDKRGTEVVLHSLPYRSDTVRLGLEAVKGAERCMFTPADQPLISGETVKALALASENEPNAIWRIACNGVSGAPVIFPQWAFEELMNLPEGKGGGAVMKKYPGCIRELEIKNSYELKDADTPEDMDELLEYRL